MRCPYDFWASDNSQIVSKSAKMCISDAMARWPLARGGKLAIALFFTVAISVVQPSLKSGGATFG